MTETKLTRGTVAYVKYTDGKQPNRIRAWPKKAPESPEGTVVGRAPERSAMLLLDVERVSVPINGKPKAFSNPHIDPHGRVWWYVRAYDGEKKTAVEGWTLEGEDGKTYLSLLNPRNVCKIMMHTWLQSYVRGGTRAYVVSDEALRIREKPSSTSPQVGSLAPGSSVKAGGEVGCDAANGRLWRAIPQGWVCESEDVEDPPGSFRREWYLLPLSVPDTPVRSTRTG